MSRVPELLEYLRQSVDDIQRAIRSHFIVTKGVPLSEYGNLIRSIKSDSGSMGSSLLPIYVTLQKQSKKLTGMVICEDVPIVPCASFKQATAARCSVMTLDVAPVISRIEGYEPIDLSTIAMTLELTDDDYDNMEQITKEE